jgi:hypothetical protein
MTSVEVDDASGEARAEWVLKWKSNFGTSTSKRVKASATVVRDGETATAELENSRGHRDEG